MLLKYIAFKSNLPELNSIDLHRKLEDSLNIVEKEPFIVRYHALISTICETFDCFGLVIANIKTDNGDTFCIPIFDLIMPMLRQYDITSYGTQSLDSPSKPRRKSYFESSPKHNYIDFPSLFIDTNSLFTLQTGGTDGFGIFDYLTQNFSRLKKIQEVYGDAVPTQVVHLFDIPGDGPITLSINETIAEQQHFFFLIGFSPRLQNESARTKRVDQLARDYQKWVSSGLEMAVPKHLSAYEPRTYLPQLEIKTLSRLNFIFNSTVGDCAHHLKQLVCCAFDFDLPYTLINPTHQPHPNYNKLVSTKFLTSETTYSDTSIHSLNMDRDIEPTFSDYLQPSSNAKPVPDKSIPTAFFDTLSSALLFLNQHTVLSNCFPSCRATTSVLSPAIPLVKGSLRYIAPNIPWQVVHKFSPEEHAFNKDQLSVFISQIVRTGIFESPDVIWRKLVSSTYAFFIYNPYNENQLEGIITTQISRSKRTGEKLFSITASALSDNLRQHANNFSSFFTVWAGKKELDKDGESIIASFSTLNNLLIGTSHRNFQAWPKLDELRLLQSYKILHTSALILEDLTNGHLKHKLACLKSFERVLFSLHSYREQFPTNSQELFSATLHDCSSYLTQLIESLSTTLPPTTPAILGKKRFDSKQSNSFSSSQNSDGLTAEIQDHTLHSFLDLVDSILLNESIAFEGMQSDRSDVKQYIIELKHLLGQYIIDNRSQYIYDTWDEIFKYSEGRVPLDHERVLMCADQHYPPRYTSSQLHYNPRVNDLACLLDPRAAYIIMLKFNWRTPYVILFNHLIKLMGCHSRPRLEQANPPTP